MTFHWRMVSAKPTGKRSTDFYFSPGARSGKPPTLPLSRLKRVPKGACDDEKSARPCIGGSHSTGMAYSVVCSATISSPEDRRHVERPPCHDRGRILQLRLY